MTLANLRGHPRVGQHLRAPDLPLRRLGPADDRARRLPRPRPEGAGSPATNPMPGAPIPLEPVTILLLLRAFASGSVALTGTEAIANGVPAFKPPEPRNAATTLTAMAILLAVLFVGITFVADALRHRARQRRDGRRAGRLHGLRRGLDRLLPLPGVHRAHPHPGGEHLLQRLPAPRRHPGRGRLHAPPVRLPRRPAGLHPGHRHPLGVAAALLVVSSTATRTRSSRSTRSASSSASRSASRAWSGTGCAIAWRGWRWRLGINAVGAVLTGVVLVVVLVQQGPRVAARGGDHPDPRRHHALHRPPVPPACAGAGAAARQGHRIAPQAQQGGHPRAEPDASSRPGGAVRTVPLGGRASRARHRGRRRGRAPARALRAHAAGRAAGHRRVALPVARDAVRALPRRDGAAAGRHRHHRGPARVRGAPLVGPTALQPDRQSAEERPPRPARHRRGDVPYAREREGNTPGGSGRPTSAPGRDAPHPPGGDAQHPAPDRELRDDRRRAWW